MSEELRPEDVRSTDSRAELEAAIAAEAEGNVQPEAEVKTGEVRADVIPPKEQTEQEKLDAAALAKQVADKEAFIQKQAAELGELRKIAQQVQQPVQQPNQPKVFTKDEINAKWYEDPVEANAMLRHNEVLQQQAQMQQVYQVARAAEQTIKQLVPEFDTLKDTMADLALQDGYSPEQVNWFKQNPFVNSDPIILYQYAQRAKAIKEINELKGKTVTQVAQKIEQAAKSSGLTSKVAPSTKQTIHDISQLKGEALRKSLEEDLREEHGGG